MLCLLALLIPSAFGVMRNFTIDDSQAEYHTGLGCSWRSAPNCRRCVAKLDPSRAHDGTWHEGKYVASGAECSITMEFTGESCVSILVLFWLTTVLIVGYRTRRLCVLYYPKSY